MAQTIQQQIVINALDKTKAGFESAKRHSNSLDDALRRTKNTIIGLFAGNIIAGIIPQFVAFSDQVIETDARIKGISSSTKEYADAKAELLRISLATGSSMDANAKLYAKLSPALAALGYETKQVTGLTEVLANGFRLGGATATEASSVMLQLAQALGAGRLNGEELNAVLEGSPPIALAIADALNITIGELKTYGEQGKLTTDIVVEALLAQQETFSKQAKELPITFGRAIENVKTRLNSFVLENKDIFTSLASGINSLADNFDTVVDAVQVLTVLIGTKLVIATAKGTQSIIQQTVAKEKLVQQTAAISKAESARAAVNARAAIVQANADRSELLASKQKELAAAKLGAIDAQAAINKQNATIATIRKNALEAEGAINSAKLNAAQLQSEQAILAARIKSLKLSIQTQTVTKARAKLVAQLKIANDSLNSSLSAQRLYQAEINTQSARSIGLTGKLTKAKAGLTAQQTALAAAINAETTAHRANTVAQQTNAASSAVLLGNIGKSANKVGVVAGAASRVGTAFSGIIGIGKTLFGLLGGWVGAAIIGVVTLASNLDSIPLAMLAIEKAARTAFAYIQFGAAALVGLPSALNRQLAIIEKESEASAQKIIDGMTGIADQEKANAAALEKSQLAAKRRALALATQEKNLLKEIDDAKAKLYRSDFKRVKDHQNSTLSSIKAIGDAEEARHEASLYSLDQFDKSAKDFARERVKVEADANNKISDSAVKLVKDLIDESEDFFEFQKLGVRENTVLHSKFSNDQLLNYKKLYTSIIGQVDKALTANKKLFVKTTADIDFFAERIKENAGSTKDFLFELEKEKLSNAERTAFATNKLIEAQSEISRLAALDQKENAYEVAEGYDDQKEKLQNLITEEASRRNDLKEGSAEQYQAIGNIDRATAALFDLEKKIDTSSKLAHADSVARRTEISNKIQDNTAKAEEFRKELELIDKELVKQREIAITIEWDEAKDAIKKLEESLDKVREKASKPIVITTVNKTVNQTTGDTGTQNKATGGKIDDSTPVNGDQGYARTRGKVSGVGSGDSQKAMLTAGEYVVNKRVVDDLGVDYLDSLNSGKDPSVIKRATGGLVDKETAKKDTQYTKDYGTAQEPWQNEYYDTVDELLNDLEGADKSSQRQGRNYADEIVNDLDRSLSQQLSLDQHNRLRENIQSNLEKLINAVSSGIEKQGQLEQEEEDAIQAEEDAVKAEEDRIKAEEDAIKAEEDRIKEEEDAKEAAEEAAEKKQQAKDDALIERIEVVRSAAVNYSRQNEPLRELSDMDSEALMNQLRKEADGASLEFAPDAYLKKRVEAYVYGNAKTEEDENEEIYQKAYDAAKLADDAEKKRVSDYADAYSAAQTGKSKSSSTDSSDTTIASTLSNVSSASSVSSGSLEQALSSLESAIVTMSSKLSGTSSFANAEPQSGGSMTVTFNSGGTSATGSFSDSTATRRMLSELQSSGAAS